MTHVLVIEDDENIRDEILELLDAEGYATSSAEEGLTGLELARAHLPDLILCDIMMPGLDGFGVLDELRQDPVTATIPFIFLTAKADKSDLRRGMELGADDYLTKPFSLTELLCAIETRMAKRAALNKKFQKQLQDLRDNLVFALPHEMRTPLTGILTGSEILLHPDLATLSEVYELAEIIHGSAKRLDRLVMNYLLYAELEIAMMDQDKVQKLRNCHTDAVPAIRQAALQQAEQAHREADLALDLQAGAPHVGKIHLEKIVQELLDNAFKYSKPGTAVRVAGAPDTTQFVVSVEDHGRGMTARQIADTRAFVQFERKIHEPQGSGLGLILAKRLAELYGGELNIESVLGEQTTVRVTLPS